MYSDTLLDHFRKPRRVGRLEPPAVIVSVENPICGDIMTLSAIIDDGVVADVRYQTRGCTASIAAGSALTDLVVGKRREEILRIDAAAVETAVGGLPNESRHAAHLASEAAKALGNRM